MADFTDAERINWLAEQFKTCTVYMSGQHPYAPNSVKLRNLHGPSFRAAIDAAMTDNGWTPAAGVAPTPEPKRSRCFDGAACDVYYCSRCPNKPANGVKGDSNG